MPPTLVNSTKKWSWDRIPSEILAEPWKESETSTFASATTKSEVIAVSSQEGRAIGNLSLSKIVKARLGRLL